MPDIGARITRFGMASVPIDTVRAGKLHDFALHELTAYHLGEHANGAQSLAILPGGASAALQKICSCVKA